MTKASHTPPTSTKAQGASHPKRDRTAEVITELNICRKNVYIYPPEHAQVQQSVDRAYALLCDALAETPEIRIGVDKQTLVCDRKRLNPKNVIFREFANALRLHEIITLSFRQGIEKQELLTFLVLIGKRQEDLAADGGIRKVVQNAGLPHVRIRTMDYGRLHVTEEKEIHTRKKASEEAEDSLWDDFVSHMMAGTLAVDDSGISLEETKRLGAVELAKLLNEKQFNSISAIEAYAQVLDRYVDISSLRPASDDSVGSDGDNAFGELSVMFEELNPDLRRQFLSRTFDTFSQDSPQEWVERFLGSMPYHMVVEMLQAANDENKEISPTLMGLIQKIVRSQNAEDTFLMSTDVADQATPWNPTEMSPDDLRSLFERKNYEKYVPQDYDDLLKDFALTPQAHEPEEAFPLQSHLATLEDAHLDRQIARLTLAFLKPNIPAEEYRVYADKLCKIAYDALEFNNFALAHTIFQVFRKHHRQKEFPQNRRIAEEMIGKFQEPIFTSRAVSAFHDAIGKNEGKARDFLLALGPKIVPDLVTLFCKQKSPNPKPFVPLLIAFKEAVSVEANRRFHDTRPGFVRNLVFMLRAAGISGSTDRMRLLLDHTDPDVQMGALTALLDFKDQWAVVFLRKSLQSPRWDLVMQAVSLATRFKVAEVVPDLLLMLKRHSVFKSDFLKNDKIIHALGHIGDPRALPTLTKLVKTAWPLHGKALAQNRRTVFESLHRYPMDHIRPLLKIGLRAKDEKIREACNTLIQGPNDASRLSRNEPMPEETGQERA